MRDIITLAIGLKQYVVPADAYYITLREMQERLKSIQNMRFGVLTDKLIEYIINDERYRCMDEPPADVLELVTPIKMLVTKNGCAILFKYQLDDIHQMAAIYENGTFARIGTQSDILNK